MKVKILGFEDRTYTKEDTGEVKEGLTLFYSKPNKSENSVGSSCGFEYITAKAFPEQFAAIMKAGESIVGKPAHISKDVRSFNGKTYSVVDEFELL